MVRKVNVHFETTLSTNELNNILDAFARNLLDSKGQRSIDWEITN